MSLNATLGGNPAGGDSPLSSSSRWLALRIGLAIVIFIGLAITAYELHRAENYGAKAAFSLLIGAAFGLVMERGRFCFFCILRDYIEFRNSSSLYAIITALAVGGIGYAILFGLFLPNSGTDRLPPNAHIGPVSWILFAGGLVFGIGMALSGACISGHLYRLGEGYSRAPFALLGSLVGFGIGFYTWYELYVSTIAYAEILWMPKWVGYSGALGLHLAVLGGISLFLMRSLPELSPQAGGRLTLARLHQSILGQRWNPLLTGSLVGIIGVISYLRVRPLGVTSQLGSIPRTVLTQEGYLGDRLPGLDTFSGCATLVVETITDNGWLVIGLVLGSLAVSLLANRFSPSSLTLWNSLTAFLGGILMGWGSMVSLGCTVGTLLSGISAFAISGWVFGFAVFVGVWIGIKLHLHTLGDKPITAW